MSADNGVYILKTKRTFKQEKLGVFNHLEGKHEHVYRVAHVSAIDNFSYFEETQLYNLGWYMNRTWGKSEVYTTKEKAQEAAEKLHKELGWTEYGISLIDASGYIFPGDI